MNREDTEWQHKFEGLTESIRQDPRNAAFTGQGLSPVFQIRREARLLIIGQAPGRKVMETMIPFRDKSGDTLMRWMGIGPETFYGDQIAILPMDFYYPGKGKTGDLPPRAFAAAEYHPALLKLMPDIRMTLLIGKYAQDYYLGGRRQRNLTETVRHYQDYLPAYFPIVHPSPLNFRWQAKNPWFMDAVVPELQKKVKALLSDQS